jgi:hypothetical protein
MDDDKKVKCVQISRDGSAGYTVPVSELGILGFELMDENLGEKYELVVTEHTQKALDDLPEFEGW